MKVKAKHIGRPKKGAHQKAEAMTITLWPDEYKRFESLRAAVSRGLPTEITRSDLVRLGLALLEQMSHTNVLRDLVKLKQERNSRR